MSFGSTTIAHVRSYVCKLYAVPLHKKVYTVTKTDTVSVDWLKRLLFL